MSITKTSNSELIFNGYKSDFLFSGFFKPQVGFYNFVQYKIYGKVCVIVIEKNKEEKKSENSASKTDGAGNPTFSNQIICYKNHDVYDFVLKATQLPKEKMQKYAVILKIISRDNHVKYEVPGSWGRILSDNLIVAYLYPESNASLTMKVEYEYSDARVDSQEGNRMNAGDDPLPKTADVGKKQTSKSAQSSSLCIVS